MRSRSTRGRCAPRLLHHGHFVIRSRPDEYLSCTDGVFEWDRQRPRTFGRRYKGRAQYSRPSGDQGLE